MPFDPTKPATASVISSAELRNQFTGLKDLIDALMPPPAETDPVFAASEAALLVAGDKAKLDGAAPLPVGETMATENYVNTHAVTNNATTGAVVRLVSGLPVDDDTDLSARLTLQNTASLGDGYGELKYGNVAKVLVAAPAMGARLGAVVLEAASDVSDGELGGPSTTKLELDTAGNINLRAPGDFATVTIAGGPVDGGVGLSGGNIGIAGALRLNGGAVVGSVAQADSVAVDMAGVVADFNSLLAKLRAMKILAD